MSFLSYVPFASALIMLFFAATVFQRYLVRRNLAFLFWAIGLLMFGVATFAEGYLEFAWSGPLFFLWYLFGALLTAAWLGHGTLLLLAKKRWVKVATAALIIASLLAAILLIMTPFDPGKYDPAIQISEQYREILPDGAPVRFITPIFNIYGTLWLVGGAIYSAYLFWRKRVLPNRVLGNMLIGMGGLAAASGSSLTRAGYGEFLYIGELLAAILMYAGFRMAARPQPEPAQAAVEQQTATAATR